VPWSRLVALITPHARGAHQALGSRPPFEVVVVVRSHCQQLWWHLSEPATEEEVRERPLNRRFAGLPVVSQLADETTILRFYYLLAKHSLASEVLETINASLPAQGLMFMTGTLVDATLIAVPS